MGWLKDWWPVIITIALGLVGFGKISEKHDTTQKRVAEIKEEMDDLKEAHPMTLTHCKERQESCHMISAAHQGNVEQDIEELRASFRSMKQCNDTQHSDIIKKIDVQHRDVINHILAVKNGNGK